jgi:hypothetical protein
MTCTNRLVGGPNIQIIIIIVEPYPSGLGLPMHFGFDSIFILIDSTESFYLLIMSVKCMSASVNHMFSFRKQVKSEHRLIPLQT